MAQLPFSFLLLFSVAQTTADNTVHTVTAAGVSYKYILVPALAGLVAQLLGLMEAIKQDAARRPNFKDWVYWLPFIVGPLLAGFAGYFSFDGNEKAFTTALGVQVGIAAPLLLKGLAAATPNGLTATASKSAGQ